MTLDISVPASGDSITSATIGQWHVVEGQSVERGQLLVSLETDKVSQEIAAEAAGVVRILVAEGDEVAIGQVIARLEGAAEGAAPVQPAAIAQEAEAPAPAPAANVAIEIPQQFQVPSGDELGEIRKAAIAAVVEANTRAAAEPAKPVTQPGAGEQRVTRRKMSPLRRKIAAQLVSAQHQAAILTTFNECDMSEVMRLRKEMQDDFTAKHGVKLGFMSFFVKAVVQALKDVPQLNARIDGEEIVENHYFDIGVAVGTDRGLVVPVVRDADVLTYAAIEKVIGGFGKKAREGALQLADLQGGVFTITNGGIYGSMMSTPIINPPQSGILGMHSIKERAVVVDGKVEIRPMMYLALSYDHRIVDGKDAVTFLSRVKDFIEKPTRLLLGV